MVGFVLFFNGRGGVLAGGTGYRCGPADSLLSYCECDQGYAVEPRLRPGGPLQTRIKRSTI